MIAHLTRDIGWPVLLLSALIVAGAWRPIAVWIRAERELHARARRIRQRGGFIEFSRKRIGE